MHTQPRTLYLHGFASSRESRKGLALRERLRTDGIELELLDLNVPSFGKQTYSAILDHLDRVDRETGSERRLRLAGSSMGGYLAARWAELHPERVERLFLLCPGFDLPSRWPLVLGEEAMRRWERDGELEVEDTGGVRRLLHWEFVEDAHGHPEFPEVTCPTRILHGIRDEIVPVDFSRRYAAPRPHVELVEVDDDHSLLGSVERIAVEMGRFFDFLPG
jgi:pimeloyl-ACP methyl ester carboxylesterase